MHKKTTSNKTAHKRAITVLPLVKFLHTIFYLVLSAPFMLASLPSRITLLRPQRIATTVYPLSSSFMGSSMSSSAGNNSDVAEFINSENSKNQVCLQWVWFARVYGPYNIFLWIGSSILLLDNNYGFCPLILWMFFSSLLRFSSADLNVKILSHNKTFPWLIRKCRY